MLIVAAKTMDNKSDLNELKDIVATPTVAGIKKSIRFSKKKSIVDLMYSWLIIFNLKEINRINIPAIDGVIIFDTIELIKKPMK